MIRKKHYLFLFILLFTGFFLNAQGVPHIVDVDQLPFSVDIISGVVVMGNFCYIKTLRPYYIAKIDLLTKEVIWQQPHSANGDL